MMNWSVIAEEVDCEMVVVLSRHENGEPANTVPVSFVSNLFKDCTTREEAEIVDTTNGYGYSQYFDDWQAKGVFG
jgi:hypothetical protein